MVVQEKVVLNVEVKQVRGLMRSLKESGTQFRRLVDDTGQLNKGAAESSTRMGKFGLRMRFATTGLRGFRMEMLGIMFFGMGIKRLFTGFLQPAFEAAGIFKIWGDILKILFLPIAMALLGPMLSLLNFVINMPGPLKKAIGVFALMGVALGTLLFLFGSITLGFGSLLLGLGTLIALFVFLDNRHRFLAFH